MKGADPEAPLLPSFVTAIFICELVLAVYALFHSEQAKLCLKPCVDTKLGVPAAVVEVTVPACVVGSAIVVAVDVESKTCVDPIAKPTRGVVALACVKYRPPEPAVLPTLMLLKAPAVLEDNICPVALSEPVRFVPVASVIALAVAVTIPVPPTLMPAATGDEDDVLTQKPLLFAALQKFV